MGVFDILPGLGGDGEADEAEPSDDSSHSGGDAADSTQPADLTPADFRERAEALAGRSDVPTLDFTVDSLDPLDELAAGPRSAVDDEVTYGSYLGETIVRAFGGEWVDEDGWQVAVELPEDRTTIAVFDAAEMSIAKEPVFAKVAARLEAEGAERVPLDERGSDEGDAEADSDPEPSAEPDEDDVAAGEKGGDEMTDEDSAPDEVAVADDDGVVGEDDSDAGVAAAVGTETDADVEAGTDADGEAATGTDGDGESDADTEPDTVVVDDPVADEGVTDDEAVAADAAADAGVVTDAGVSGEVDVVAGDQDEADGESAESDEPAEPTTETTAAHHAGSGESRSAVEHDHAGTDDEGAGADDAESTADQSPVDRGAGTDETASVLPFDDAGDGSDDASAEDRGDVMPIYEEADETTAAASGAEADDSMVDAPDEATSDAATAVDGPADDGGPDETGVEADASIEDDAADDDSPEHAVAGDSAADYSATDNSATEYSGDDEGTPVDDDEEGAAVNDGVSSPLAEEADPVAATGDLDDERANGVTDDATVDGEDPDEGTVDEAIADGEDADEETDDDGPDADPVAPERYVLRAAAEELAEGWPSRDLDFTPESLPRLDAFVDDQWDGRFHASSLADRTVDHEDTDDPLAQLGAYYAEVLVRWLEGEWVATDDGEGAVAVPDVGEKVERVDVFALARECLVAPSTFAYRYDALVNRLYVDKPAVSDGRADVFDDDRDSLTSADVITQFVETAEEFVDDWPEYPLDYTPRSVRGLDEITDRLSADLDLSGVALADGTDPKSLWLTARATAAGAYYAAVLLRHQDAQWRIGDDVELVVDRPGGERTVDPVATAAVCLRGEGSFVETYASLSE